MRKLTAFVFAVILAAMAGPAFAADYPVYPPYEPPELPPVDHGLKGSFYLRGSLAGNVWWAREAIHYQCGCFGGDAFTATALGYGYSLGAGFGYETGKGFRADVTFDYLSNNGLTGDNGVEEFTAHLRSGLVLANAYYDVPLGGYGHADGGFGLYAGAGLGFAYNHTDIYDGGVWQKSGSSVEAAGAVMAGVSYDMGNMVADLGYRGIYMPKIMSQPTVASGDLPYIISDNFIHEVRGTLRYRFQ